MLLLACDELRDFELLPLDLERLLLDFELLPLDFERLPLDFELLPLDFDFVPRAAISPPGRWA